MNATEYLITVGSIVPMLPEHLYGEKEGAERLAREVGWCLKDSPTKEAERAISDSYNFVCVIGYNLNPKIDKKEWDKQVRIGYEK